jgi:hypothetical protein
MRSLIERKSISENPDLRARLAEALKEHSARLFLSEKSSNEEHMARQLHENYDYAAGRILIHLSMDETFDPSCDDAALIAAAGEVINKHLDNGLWPRK